MKSEGVADHIALFVVGAQAGGAAVVIAQAALLERGHCPLPDGLGETVAGDKVAPQQIALVFVHPHIEFAARTRIKTAQRRVAVHRVELIGPDVLQQALPRVFVGVKRRGQQHIAPHDALEIKRRAGCGIGLAAVEVARPAFDLALKTVAPYAGANDGLIAKIDDAFDQACSDHLAGFGHKTDHADGLY